MGKWWPAVVVVVAVVVGVGGFFGGTKYGEGKTPSPQAAAKALQSMTPEQLRQVFQQGGGFPGGPAGTGGANGQFRRNGGGGFVNGQIVSKDAESMTVKLQDGSTKIVFFTSSTPVSRQATGSPSDLTTGTDVLVNGTTNSDGSVTAQRIQVVPAGEQPFGAPGRLGATTTTAGQ